MSKNVPPKTLVSGSFSEVQEKKQLERYLDLVLKEGYSQLIKLDYLDSKKVEEITEIIVTVLVTPRVMRMNKDQMRLFDPDKYEGSN